MVKKGTLSLENSKEGDPVSSEGKVGNLDS